MKHEIAISLDTRLSLGAIAVETLPLPDRNDEEDRSQ